MAEIKVESDEITEAIGLLWRVEELKAATATIDVLQKMLRRQTLAHLLNTGHEMDVWGNIPLTLTMPCGNKVTYTDIDDVPIHDVPCSCDNPNHWLIKYEYRRNNGNTDSRGADK